MITLRVEIIDYDKDLNNCKARLLNGDVIELDPYGGCAIAMTDDEYAAGNGADIVGKTYLLTAYSVYKDLVVPHEGGMICLT